VLLKRWSLFEERVREIRQQQVVVKRREPVLVALGYGYDSSILQELKSIVCLSYDYHNVTLSDDTVNEQRRGKAKIQAATPSRTHPPVTKRQLFLKRCPPELREAFSRIDRTLGELDGVKAKYVKDSARYRLPEGYFAEAKIHPKSIVWTCGTCVKWKDREQWGHCKMSADIQTDRILDRLRRAHMKAS